MKLFPHLAERTKLTFEEMALYYRVKLRFVKNFDQANPDHEVGAPLPSQRDKYLPCCCIGLSARSVHYFIWSPDRARGGGEYAEAKGVD